MKTIFIVDDNDTNRTAAKEALEGYYKALAVPSAEKMFRLAEKITPDLILLDIDMPQIDGFLAMEKLKTIPHLKTVPVIFLTAHQDPQTEVKGLEAGVIDFISKPFAAKVLVKRLKMHLETDKLIKESQKDLRDLQNATISVIANMVENRDEVTGGHIERTQLYLYILVKEMMRVGLYAEEMKKWDSEILLSSAQLHDVGKIKVSDLILNKPGKLTDEEFALMKKHSIEGERIVDSIMSKVKGNEFLRHAKMFAGYHHEKWNGMGYPRGLNGESIPLQGRILAVVDVYDALVSERPYKKPFSHKEAVEIISQDSGKHFDPKIIELFLNVENEFLEMCKMQKEVIELQAKSI